MTHVPEMPSDCPQPADHGPSYYLSLPCRSFRQAVTDISKVRDLEPWVFDELRLRRQSATIYCMAQARAARAARAGRR
jgi:hypothetical protein